MTQGGYGESTAETRTGSDVYSGHASHETPIHLDHVRQSQVIRFGVLHAFDRVKEEFACIVLRITVG